MFCSLHFTVPWPDRLTSSTRRILKLNPQLAGIMRTKADQLTVTMEDGINKFIGRMTHMHEVTLAGNKLLHTGKLEPIDMRVTVRSGGKKV